MAAENVIPVTQIMGPAYIGESVDIGNGYLLTTGDYKGEVLSNCGEKDDGTVRIPGSVFTKDDFNYIRSSQMLNLVPPLFHLDAQSQIKGIGCIQINQIPQNEWGIKKLKKDCDAVHQNACDAVVGILERFIKKDGLIDQMRPSYLVFFVFGPLTLLAGGYVLRGIFDQFRTGSSSSVSTIGRFMRWRSPLHFPSAEEIGRYGKASGLAASSKAPGNGMFRGGTGLLLGLAMTLTLDWIFSSYLSSDDSTDLSTSRYT